MTYYTLQIHYGDTVKPEIEERKDLNAASMNETEWITQLRAELYTTGFAKKISPTAWEFISPFRIITIFLIKQDKKYGI